MKCPICKLENPDDAMICDCGYNFFTQTGGIVIKKKRKKLIILLMISTVLSFIVGGGLFCTYNGIGASINFEYICMGIGAAFILWGITIFLVIIIKLLNLILKSRYIFKRALLGLIIGIIIVSIPPLSNRLVYGTGNIFSIPSRVIYNGLYYSNDGQIVTFTDKEKPKYEVSRIIDRITGKRIYSEEKDFIGNGKVVYLRLDEVKYLVLGCGGGG